MLGAGGHRAAGTCRENSSNENNFNPIGHRWTETPALAMIKENNNVATNVVKF
jgi:hypothetical protein